jgi:LysR family carnitine catabolism transcriptional activator
MNVTLKQLRAFVAIAESGSFAEASERVHLSQPALSIAIKNFEDCIGGKLLARSTRKVALTPEGHFFIPVAKRMIADWDEAFTDLNNLFSLQRGKLAIAAMPSYASTELPMLLKTFRDNYPQVNIKVHDVIAEDTVAMVRTGKVELGITFDPGLYDDLIFKPLFTDQFIAVIPIDHPLCSHSKISLVSPSVENNNTIESLVRFKSSLML